MPNLPTSSNPQFNDVLLQRFFMSPQEKADKETGKRIVKAFYAAETSNDANFNFFKRRNARWIEILLWCKGSQKMTEFLDLMSVSDANKAFAPVDMEQTRIAAQFVGTLIQSMAKNKIYPCVTAIDDGSLNEKEQRLWESLYRMHEVNTIGSLQNRAGLHMEPPNAYVPDDETAARVHFELEDRLPKEIHFEKILAKIQTEIHFEKIANRKTLFNMTVLNSAFTKIERIAAKVYRPRVCINTNMVYNFFLNDLGEYEVTQIGEFLNIKVKDFRKQFLKTDQNPGGITEQEIFELAKLSTNKSIGVFNFMWNNDWALTNFFQNRPYDDCNILVIDCEIDCGEDAYWVEKSDPYGKKTIEGPKKSIPYIQVTKEGTVINQPKPDDVSIIKRQKNIWMRGVYAPYGDTMLYWGAPDIIISTYTNTAKPLSSYTAVIANNDGDYVPSLFERSMEPLREYQLVKLERKKLIASVRPAGLRIDVETARNIDLGDGNTIEWTEIVRIFNQTGVELWSSRGIDPLQPQPPPLSNTVHDESIEKIIGLTNVMAGIRMEIRELMGVPPSRDGSPLPSRTPAELAENQEQSSYNVSDFVAVANSQLWEQTFYKLCLLYWNDAVKEEPASSNELVNTRFDVSVRMKITDYERQLVEADIQRYSQMLDGQGKPLLSPKDALMIREIDNYKLACWYLDATEKKNRRNAIQESQMLQEQNAAVQQQSAAQAQKQAMAAEQLKQQGDDAKARNEKELSVINGLFEVWTKWGSMPAELQPLSVQSIQNVMIPVMAENQQMKAILAQQVAQNNPQQNQVPNGPPPPDQQSQPQNQPPQQPQQAA